MQGRINWIDFAKGVAIILVVVGHIITVDGELNIFCSIFRMPFFFLTAGYLLNTEKWRGGYSKFKSKLSRRLLLPYFTANFTWYPIWFVLCYYTGILTAFNWDKMNPWLSFLAIFAGNNDSLGCGLVLFPLWFLPCLLYAELIFLKLVIRFSRQLHLFLAVIGVAIIGYELGIYFQLPLGIDIAFVAQVFILAGNSIRKYNFLDKLNFGACGILAVIFSVAFYFNGFIDMNARNYSNLTLFYGGGIAGSLLLLQISMTVANFQSKFNEFIIYCGRQSLAILVFHPIILAVAAQLLETRFDSIWGFIFTLAACGVIVPAWLAKNFGDKPIIKYFCA